MLNHSLIVKLPKIKKANLENSLSLDSKIHKLHNKSEKIIITLILEPPKSKSILPNLEINLKIMIKTLKTLKRKWNPNK